SVIPCFRAPHASHSFPTRRSSDLFHRLTTQRITGNHIVASRREVGELGNSRCKHRRAGVRGTITVEPAKFKSGEVSMLRAVSSADRKSTRLNSSHVKSSYAVYCLK